MKTTFISSALAVTLVLLASSALADEKVKTEKESPPRKAPAEVKKDQQAVDITGSNIKQKVRRRGVVTDSASQVVVLDRDLIDQSGAADLKQVLIRRGVR